VSQEQEIDPNAWMVTFADLVMLLLTFFVLLLTMSSMDSKKLENLFTHFKDATGVLEFSGAKEVGTLAALVEKYNDSASVLVIDQSKFMTALEMPGSLQNMAKDLQEKMDMTDDGRGMVLSFQEDILFAAGEVTAGKDIFPFLDAIAEGIEGCSNDILIMGHADSSPIGDNKNNTNWELSISRGLSVLEYLLKQKQLAPERFSVGGYGASKPLSPGDSPEHQTLNRRVEIIFKHLEEV
jgi:chemotaxis protein MotB